MQHNHQNGHMMYSLGETHHFPANKNTTLACRYFNTVAIGCNEFLFSLPCIYTIMYWDEYVTMYLRI